MRCTILQWNIWYREGIDNIIATLKDIRPDIACLQELTTTSPYNPDIDMPARIAEELQWSSAFHIAQSWALPEDTRTLGNGVFTRFPILSKRQIYVQDPAENTRDYSAEGRLYVEATVALPGSALTVGTAHLSYTQNFLPTPRKTAEMHRLLAILREPRERYIFSGDLNALPDSSCMQELLALPTLRHCGPDLTQGTWTTKPFEYGGFKADSLDWRLDYAFATPDVQVIGANVLSTTSSDHLPLLLTVEL